MNEPTRRFSFTSLSHVPLLPPIALERGGVVLGYTPTPCCSLPSPWISLGALIPAPTPTWLQQMDQSFRGLFQLSEGGKPAPGHTWVPAPTQLQPRTRLDADELWGQEHRGHRCPPSARHTPIYSRGNGGLEAKGQPTVPAPPRRAGLPSRPGVTRPARGSCSAVAVLKFLIAFGARRPLVPITARLAPSLGTSSRCACGVQGVGALPGSPFTGRQLPTPAHNAL